MFFVYSAWRRVNKGKQSNGISHEILTDEFESELFRISHG